MVFRKAEGRQVAIAGNKVNHRGKALIGIKTTCFPFSRLYHTVNPLTDSVGHAVVEVGQYLLLVVEERGGGILHWLQPAAAHPGVEAIKGGPCFAPSYGKRRSYLRKIRVNDISCMVIGIFLLLCMKTDKETKGNHEMSYIRQKIFL